MPCTRQNAASSFSSTSSSPSSSSAFTSSCCRLLLISENLSGKNNAAFRKIIKQEKEKKKEENGDDIEILEAEQKEGVEQKEGKEDEESNEWDIVSLPHPSNANVMSQFLYKNSQIFQMQKCDRSIGRCSAFIGNWVESDGSLWVAYPVDPLFFLINLLLLKKHRYVSLYDLCDLDFSQKCNNSNAYEDNYCDNNEVSLNIKKCLLNSPNIRTRILNVCDTQTIDTGGKEQQDENNTFYKINMEKVKKFLTKKVEKMTKIIEEQKLFFSECWYVNFVTTSKNNNNCNSNSNNNNSNSNSNNNNSYNGGSSNTYENKIEEKEDATFDRKAAKEFCWSIISLYICNEICDVLNIKNLMGTTGEKNTTGGGIKRASVNSTAQKKDNKIDESADKRNSKKAKISDAVKNTASITSFFKKT